MNSGVHSQSISVPGSPSSIQRLERRARIVEFVLYSGLVFVIGSSIFWAWVLNNRVTELNDLVISVSNVRIIGSTDLCPGDVLTYSYVLRSNRDGVVEVDAAIWSKQPPQTSIYSLPVRAILDGQSAILVQEEWIVPEMPLTRQVSELSPGEYERRLAFRNLYQQEAPSTVKIPFSIRENCR